LSATTGIAAGAVEAATANIRALAARLRLINQQIKEAERQLDELCAAIEAAAPGQICEQRDVAILRSCSGLGRRPHRTIPSSRPALRQSAARSRCPGGLLLRAPPAAARSVLDSGEHGATLAQVGPSFRRLPRGYSPAIHS